MFTGIIEEIGTIAGISKNAKGMRLSLIAEKIRDDMKLGDSVSVNGACLTVSDIRKDALICDVMAETLKKTTIGGLNTGDEVNLERAMRQDSRMGGHFVTGHIDYKAEIIEIIDGSEGTGFKVSLPDEFSRFVVSKGSVAVDGVSLTVAEFGKGHFTVYLIPHTLKATVFSKKKTGDSVNVETDILAKYVAKEPLNKDNTLYNALKKYDYI